MRIQPLHDNVLVKPIENRVTKGGLHIPDTSDDPVCLTGKVVAVGPGKLINDGVEGTYLHPLQVKVGDIVHRRRYTGQVIEVDGEDLLIIAEGDILAVAVE